MSTGFNACTYLGGDCKAFYNSATYESPVWVEIDEAGDVAISDLSNNAIEVLTRSGDWATNKVGKTRATIDMQYLYRANKTVWDYLKGQFFLRNSGLIDLAIMDGDMTTGSKAEGLRLIAYLNQFPVSQGVEEVVMHDSMQFVPAYACDDNGAKIEPVWYVVPEAAVLETAAVALDADSPSVTALKQAGLKLPVEVASDLIRRRRLQVAKPMRAVTVGQALAENAGLAKHIGHMPESLVVSIEGAEKVSPKK